MLPRWNWFQSDMWMAKTR